MSTFVSTFVWTHLMEGMLREEKCMFLLNHHTPPHQSTTPITTINHHRSPLRRKFCKRKPVPPPPPCCRPPGSPCSSPTPLLRSERPASSCPSSPLPWAHTQLRRSALERRYSQTTPHAPCSYPPHSLQWMTRSLGRVLEDLQSGCGDFLPLAEELKTMQKHAQPIVGIGSWCGCGCWRGFVLLSCLPLVRNLDTELQKKKT